MNFVPRRARNKRGPARTPTKGANCARSIASAKIDHRGPAAIENAARNRGPAHPAADAAIRRIAISVDRIRDGATHAAVKDVPTIAIVDPDNRADLDKIAGPDKT
jgi:hypothetical protein